MILVIDAGNTRVKWGVWAEGAWQGKGGLGSQDMEGLERGFGKFRPGWVGVSCVAGTEMRASLSAILGRLGCPVYWLQPEADAFGVRNGYRNPGNLGADRWANLVACRNLGLAPCVVVSLGTAVTADALTADGRFLGGIILPGAGLMRKLLQEGTAGVAEVLGEVTDFPRATGDAVETGITLALAGAVAGLRAKLATREGGEVAVVLTGGDSGRLLGKIPPPVQVVDDLVLEGLLWMARDLGVQGS